MSRICGGMRRVYGSAVSHPEHAHLDPSAKAVLAETLDVARATAEGRVARGDLEPFALVHADADLSLVLLGDVAEALEYAGRDGSRGRTLLSARVRWRSRSRWRPSPHPTARRSIPRPGKWCA
jgi:hypothetical protein